MRARHIINVNRSPCLPLLLSTCSWCLCATFVCGGRFLTGEPRSDNKILGTDICSRAADCKSYKRFRALASFNTISRATVMSCYKRLSDRGDLISGTEHGEAWT